MIAGILLGDGFSRQAHWQTSKYKGKTVLLHSLEAMINSDLDIIHLVIGKDYHLILNKVKIPASRVRILMNRRFDRGLSTYLKVGLQSLPIDTDAVMIVSADYPQLDPSILNKMISSFKKDKPGILVPVYNNQKGFPLLFHSRHFINLRKLSRDDIGVSLFDKFHRDIFLLDVQDPGIINRYDDLRSLETAEMEKARIEKLDKMKKKGAPDGKHQADKSALGEGASKKTDTVKTSQKKEDSPADKTSMSAFPGGKNPEVALARPAPQFKQKEEKRNIIEKDNHAKKTTEDDAPIYLSKSIELTEAMIMQKKKKKKEILEKLKEKMEVKNKGHKHKDNENKLSSGLTKMVPQASIKSIDYSYKPVTEKSEEVHPGNVGEKASIKEPKIKISRKTRNSNDLTKTIAANKIIN